MNSLIIAIIILLAGFLIFYYNSLSAQQTTQQAIHQTTTTSSISTTSSAILTTTTSAISQPSDNWGTEFFGNVSSIRNLPYYYCAYLSDFAQLRFTTMSANYSITHYGYDSDLSNYFGILYGKFAEEYFHPNSTSTPADFLSTIIQTAPVHWQGLSSSNYTFYGFALARGSDYGIYGPNNGATPCPVTELTEPDVNVASYLAQYGCTVVNTTDTWFVTEISSVCPAPKANYSLVDSRDFTIGAYADYTYPINLQSNQIVEFKFYLKGSGTVNTLFVNSTYYAIWTNRAAGQPIYYFPESYTSGVSSGDLYIQAPTSGTYYFIISPYSIVQSQTVVYDNSPNVHLDVYTS